MIFTAGTRQCGAQFTVAKRAAERGNSADHPKHQQGEARVNVSHLKTKAREDACANDIRDNNPAGSEESNSPQRSGGMVHFGQDNGIDAPE